MEAADNIYSVLQKYQANDTCFQSKILAVADRDAIKKCFMNFIDENDDVRNDLWCKEIKNGSFSFGAESVEYIPKGKNSWKYLALNTLDDNEDPNEIFTYTNTFSNSDWKKFHDAVIEHCDFVMNKLLPDHNIKC